MSATDHTDRLRRALIAIRGLESRIDELERRAREPIAIVGMACRLPGAPSLDAYWDLLRSGRDAIREVPETRWSTTGWFDADPTGPGKSSSRWGGFLDDVDRFDAAFFGISPREARAMDPQHRILLEVAWDALEDAGQTAESVRESHTGVFIGLTASDYVQISLAGDEPLNAYYITGCGPSFVAGRLAHVLGLHGPALAVDTACSSSLMAVHLACRSLQTGECDRALAGGVNLLLRPESFVAATKARMLAPDGHCKTFDDAADGFVRSEGCGVLVLKRLSDAVADEDRIYACIRGTAANQDGATSGLTVPSKQAQEAVIREALERARLAPTDIDYVEAHGTGTPLGDPIELRAVSAVFTPGRPADRPLLVGAVKTNIGHLESAAGIAGLIKLALSLDREAVPPHLHLRRLTALVDWHTLRVKVPTTLTAWPRGARPRIGGVSSFGASGTNVHAVLEEAPAPAVHDDVPVEPVLELSAKTPGALAELTRRYAEWLAHSPSPLPSLRDICFTARHRRTRHDYRLAVPARDLIGLRAALETFVSGETRWQALRGPHTDRERAVERGRVVSLPSYPWQRERFWIEPSSRFDAEPPLKPVRLRTAFVPGPVFEITLQAGRGSFVDDHRFGMQIVCPATGFIEMARSAFAEAFHTTTVRIEQLQIEAPLFVPDADARVVQLRLGPLEHQASDCTIAGLGTDGTWTVHATMRLVACENTDTPPRIDLAGARERCVERRTDAMHVSILEAMGLRFGPAFATVRDIVRRDGEALATIALPLERAHEATNYGVHPALLDGAIQALWHTTPEAADGQIRRCLPAVVERVHLYAQAGPAAFAHATMRSTPQDLAASIVGDVRIVNDAGDALATLEGVRLVPIQTPFTDGHRPTTSTISWQPLPAPALAARAAASGAWMVVGRTADQDLLRTSLTRAGQPVHLTSPSDTLRASLISELRRQTPGPQVCGLAYVASLDATPAGDSLESGESAAQRILHHQREAFSTVVDLAHALAETGLKLPVMVITRGAQAVHAGEPPVAIEQAPVWGFVRSLRLELPELRWTLIDLDPAAHADVADALLRLWTVDSAGLAQYPELAVRGDHYLTPDLTPLQTGAPFASTLTMSHRGSVDYLTVEPAERRAPRVGEVEIEVRATGLNFRDVLNVLDMYPGDAGPLGHECAGVVVRAGTNVGDLRVGDAVVVVARDCFRRYLTVPADLVVVTPPHIDFAQACTLPAAFMTAAYALRTLASVSRGERVLIHAAAGGVGLAAVQIARRAGAEIFATAGSVAKRAYLESLGVEHVLDSRTLDFVHGIRERTKGRGVDVVLNSLAGTFIEASLSVTATNGRFVEIGRTGAWDVERMRTARPDVSYHLLNLADVIAADRKAGRRLLEDVVTDAAQGVLQPLPCTSFPFDQAAAAFRYMAQAKHIGKIVVTQQPASTCPVVRGGDASYLITGGTGAIGLRLAQALAAAGARHVVLVARQRPAPQVSSAIEAIEADTGARVMVVRANVADPDDVSRLIAMFGRDVPHLKGAIHAAGVLDDGLAVQQDWARMEHVLAPKISGAWLLHRATRAMDLDWFALCSSASSLLGSRGQAAYAGANAFLDALAHHRRALGLPGVSFNWGPWTGGGMFAGVDARTRATLARRGILPMNPDDASEAFLSLCAGDVAQTIVVAGTPSTRGDEAAAAPPESAVIGPTTTMTAAAPTMSPPDTTGTPPLVARLRAPGVARVGVMQDAIRRRVLHVLDLPRDFPLEDQQGLRDVGLDSLMAMELRNLLQEDIGRPLSVTLAFDHPTVHALTRHLLDDVLGFATNSDVATGAAPVTTTHDIRPDGDNIAAMTEAEAEAMLLAELQSLNGMADTR